MAQFDYDQLKDLDLDAALELSVDDIETPEFKRAPQGHYLADVANVALESNNGKTFFKVLVIGAALVEAINPTETVAALIEAGDDDGLQKLMPKDGKMTVSYMLPGSLGSVKKDWSQLAMDLDLGLEAGYNMRMLIEALTDSLAGTTIEFKYTHRLQKAPKDANGNTVGEDKVWDSFANFRLAEG